MSQLFASAGNKKGCVRYKGKKVDVVGRATCGFAKNIKYVEHTIAIHCATPRRKNLLVPHSAPLSQSRKQIPLRYPTIPLRYPT